ncbi:MAG TPA: hypothetical protein VK835_13905 [Bacteroidia bacterium]|jgi:hypothetical protein|nr:hypothetical protein [Bacteroidia bacterium]
MENLKNQNEEALLNAFKIEELEERLETAPWSKDGCTGVAACSYPAK